MGSAGPTDFCVLNLHLVVVLLLTGCSTIPRGNIEAFSGGVTAAKRQTVLAFQAVNSLASQEIIDHAASRPKLTEEEVFILLPRGSVAVWERTFVALEKYSQNLILLTSKDLTRNQEPAIVNLAKQVRAAGEALQAEGITHNTPAGSPGIAAAIAELGRLLLQAQAQSDAQKALRNADPHVRSILIEMAGIVGETNQTGIRGTVNVNWTRLRNAVQEQFREESNPVRKRACVVRFLSYMDQEDTQDQVLASLYRSLMALADAHHVLAEGRASDLFAAIAPVSDGLAETRDVCRQLAALPKIGSDDAKGTP